MAVDTGSVIFDKKDQLEKTIPHILEGESLLVVYDMKGAGTGFLAVTDRRVIFQDKAFLRNKTAMVTVPFSKITAVAVKDESWFSHHCAIQAGSNLYEFEFRNAEKARHAYQLICQHLL